MRGSKCFVTFASERKRRAAEGKHQAKTAGMNLIKSALLPGIRHKGIGSAEIRVVESLFCFVGSRSLAFLKHLQWRKINVQSHINMAKFFYLMSVASLKLLVFLGPHINKWKQSYLSLHHSGKRGK